MDKQKVPVSLRALIQRINRKLAQAGQMLKKSRGLGVREEVGDYYVIDVNRNLLLWMRVDPENFGKKIGVLQEWERVEE